MADKVLFTSVPQADHELLRRVMPEAVVTEAPLSEQLAARHADAVVLSVMVHDEVPPEVVRWFPKLRGVVTRSTGFDHLPLAALDAHDVPACSLYDYAASSVAQLTVAFMLGCLRRVPEATIMTSGRGVAGGPAWERKALVGRHLAEVRVGVLGTGRIGAEVVRLLSGMGAHVVGHDLVPDPSLARLPRFRYVGPLAAFASELDVLSVHLPLTDTTRGLVDEGLLARLARGAVLVNTARGAVVDQGAVAAALRTGHLGGYAADVLPGEPHPYDIMRFREFTNVWLTPHLGAYDQAAIRARYTETARAAEALRQRNEAGYAPYLVPPRS